MSTTFIKNVRLLGVLEDQPDATRINADVLILESNPFDDLCVLQGQSENMPLIMKAGKVRQNTLH